MLGYASGFFFGDMGLSDVIQNRRFAVVDMAHYYDYGRSGNCVFFCFHFIDLALNAGV